MPFWVSNVLPTCPVAETPVKFATESWGTRTSPTAVVPCGNTRCVPQAPWFQAPDPQPLIGITIGILTKKSLDCVCPVAWTFWTSMVTVTFPDAAPDVPIGPCDNGEKPNIYYLYYCLISCTRS